MIKKCNQKLFLGGVGVLLGLLTPPSTTAQVIPDATLPQSSNITADGNVNTITGGTVAGSNLFHSFDQFSVPINGVAYFNNTLDIQNIFSRVTGGSVSNIDGILRANGTASLFLLNPNGIIFGPNAQLNIGGSFIGSTASSINFADGTQFSATTPQITPLLKISVPTGLQFGSNSGAISVRGPGYNLPSQTSLIFPIVTGSSSTGLQVQPGKTLAIVGGDVSLEGGILKAGGGRIELGSVDDGLVSLNSNISGWTLSYESVPSFKNIQLSKQSLVDASGFSSGSIQLQGANVTFNSGSIVLLQNQGMFPSGQISINALESLELSGTSLDAQIGSGLFSETLGAGRAGDITVLTKRVNIQGGAIISNRAFSLLGIQEGGNINIKSSESIRVIDSSSLNPRIYSNIGAATFGAGKAGNIRVSTSKLTATGGGLIGSTTFSTGLGGNVTINAVDSIELSGVAPIFFTPSSLSTATLGSANAGELKIEARKLVVRNGATVNAATGNTGDAGNITIKASESVEVSGRAPGSINPSLVISGAYIADSPLQQFFGLPEKPAGAGKSVTIETDHLKVTNGASVSVRNQGKKDAGTVTVDAKSIFLDNQGSITATTSSGQGGEINLKTQSFESRHKSPITATAEGGNGRGGNIRIDADTLVALEDSDIMANASGGPGGNIQINAQGIFGIESRNNPTPESDITASSGIGIGGLIEINGLDFDARNTLTPLQSNFVSTEQVVEGSCLARRNTAQGSFVVTGNGGLPITPYSNIEEWEALTGGQAASDESVQSKRRSVPTLNPSVVAVASWKLGDPIIEAQGITALTNGRVLLGAKAEQPVTNAQNLVCYKDLNLKDTSS